MVKHNAVKHNAVKHRRISRTAAIRIALATVLAGGLLTTVVVEGAAQAAGPSATYPGCGLILEGQHGDCVRTLQHDLNRVNSAYRLSEDGVFSVATRKALLDFQGRNHLPADGNAGPVTVTKLRDQAGRTFVRSPRPGLPVAASRGPAGCTVSASPTVADYASGRECAPPGFPYEPLLKQTKAGVRAMDPYTDGCSHIPDTGAFYNFKNACATHDYMADLKRFGAKGVTEPRIDNQLLLDTLADCKGRNVVARADCEVAAREVRGGVRLGDYSRGDKIATTPQR